MKILAHPNVMNEVIYSGKPPQELAFFFNSFIRFTNHTYEIFINLLSIILEEFMPSSQKQEEKLAAQQQIDKKREPYQTPDIVYEGTISIRAGSPLGFEPKNSPFAG